MNELIAILIIDNKFLNFLNNCFINTETERRSNKIKNEIQYIQITFTFEALIY